MSVEIVVSLPPGAYARLAKHCQRVQQPAHRVIERLVMRALDGQPVPAAEPEPEPVDEPLSKTDQILSLLERGDLTRREIASIVGVTGTRVSHVAKAHGYPMRQMSTRADREAAPA